MPLCSGISDSLSVCECHIALSRRGTESCIALGARLGRLLKYCPAPPINISSTAVGSSPRVQPPFASPTHHQLTGTCRSPVASLMPMMFAYSASAQPSLAHSRRAVAARYVVQNLDIHRFRDEAIMLIQNLPGCLLLYASPAAGIGFHAARDSGQLHRLAGEVGTGHAIHPALGRN